MIKPDYILIQPINVDYPGWRYQLSKYRNLFNKVILCLSDQGGQPNITEYIKNSLQKYEVTFIDPKIVRQEPYHDWAMRAFHAGFKQVKASHVLVGHHDFIIHNEKLLETVFSSGYELVSHIDNFDRQITPYGRFENDFLFMNMDIWNNSSKDINVKPGLDHFGSWSVEVRSMYPEWRVLEDFGLLPKKDWTHLRGLTYNYIVLQEDKFNSIFPKGPLRQEFILYNRYLLSLNIDMHPHTKTLVDLAANLTI